jgi:hypothetical protein
MNRAYYINPLRIGGGRVRIPSDSISCIYKNDWGQTAVVTTISQKDILVTASVDEISKDLHESYRVNV